MWTLSHHAPLLLLKAPPGLVLQQVVDRGGHPVHRWMRPAGDRWIHRRNGKWSGAAKHRERIDALRIPPAWTDVRVNTDPKAKLQATGVDGKGRRQYIYSAAHQQGAAAKKFERIRAFAKVLPGLRFEIKNDMDDPEQAPKFRDSALILAIIDKTAIRVGSNRDTKAETPAYGASTLRAEHIKIEGPRVSLAFTGKKGVAYEGSFEERDIAKALGDRLFKARAGKVFSATDADVRDYLRTNLGTGFLVKDLRTYHGTAEAVRAVAEMPVPEDGKARKKARAAVVKRVAAYLGNTPAVALRSYIDPGVFDAWVI